MKFFEKSAKFFAPHLGYRGKEKGSGRKAMAVGCKAFRTTQEV
jgi:hypothetical protein